MILSRRHLLLGAAAALLPAHAARATASQPDSLVHWNSGGPFFGGFSGIALSSDRRRALLLSDRGFLVRIRLLRDDTGALTGVEKIEHVELHDRRGRRLTGDALDAEGIDQRPDGTLFVAFESPRSRIWRYDDEGGAAVALPASDGWSTLPGNQGIEALALDAAGEAFALPEAPQGGGFPLYRLRGGSWQVIALLPQRGDFVPVGADFGPDGALYLLERRFRLAFFASRISRLRPGAWDQPETLVETGLGALDNHEGLAITRDAQEQIWATTVSDDNQHPLQRTEIAEFRLT